MELKTKKALDESQKAKDSAKAADSTKKKAIVAAQPGADIKKQEDSLVPKEAKAAKKLTKKESPDAKVAKKEAAKKEPVEPEKVAEKAATKKDDSKTDYWAIREAVAASHNASKLDEAKLKTWIKTCESLLDKADFTQAVDLRNSIERFQEAIEALKQPKGLEPAAINQFLSSAAGAANMKQDAVKDLIEKGEELRKAASKTQVKEIQGGLEKLYKLGGNSD
ncbi:MAG: hypothetical protein IT385_25225 [Deltaproteobacteria bacterium]|nr:hypothetical protein [Deltaproteobacteria bacterium]